jgi:arylsulfatase A-like enzyme
VCDSGRYTGSLSTSLDQLAASGVSFTHAFANHPLCAPSRSSFLSGLHGYTSNNYAMERWYQNPILNASMTMQEFFKFNGYKVFGTGKLQHHGPKYDNQIPDSKVNQMYDEFGHGSDYGPFAFDETAQVASPAVPSLFRDLSKIDGSFGRLLTGYNGLNAGGLQKSDDTTFRYVSD